MELIIKINMDNDAYKQNEVFEIQENLNDVMRKIVWGDTNGIVLDSNGNKTGYFEINDEEKE